MRFSRAAVRSGVASGRGMGETLGISGGWASFKSSYRDLMIRGIFRTHRSIGEGWLWRRIRLQAAWVELIAPGPIIRASGWSTDKEEAFEADLAFDGSAVPDPLFFAKEVFKVLWAVSSGMVPFHGDHRGNVVEGRSADRSAAEGREIGGSPKDHVLEGAPLQVVFIPVVGGVEDQASEWGPAGALALEGKAGELAWQGSQGAKGKIGF